MSKSYRVVITTLLVAACRRQGVPAVPDTGSAMPPNAARSGTVTAARAPVDSAVPDTGVRTNSSGQLVFPIVLANACQGEDCETTFPALACGEAVLRAAPSANAAIVAHIARGDTVDVRRTDLHVLHPGVVILKRAYVLDSDPNEDGGGARVPRSDTLRFAAGDTLFLLRYLELGYWLWWHGRPSSGMEFWAGPKSEGFGGVTHSSDSSIAVAHSQPTIAEWWLIEPHGGAPAWWLRDSSETLLSIPQMKHWQDSCPRSP